MEDGCMDWKMYFNLINQQTWIYFQTWEGIKSCAASLQRAQGGKVDNTILNPAMIYLYGLLSSIVFYSRPWIFPRLIVPGSPGASVVSLSAADWQDKPTMGPAPCPCRRHSTEAAELGGKQVVCLCQNI